MRLTPLNGVRIVVPAERDPVHGTGNLLPVSWSKFFFLGFVQPLARIPAGWHRATIGIPVMGRDVATLRVAKGGENAKGVDRERADR